MVESMSRIGRVDPTRTVSSRLKTKLIVSSVLRYLIVLCSSKVLFMVSKHLSTGPEGGISIERFIWSFPGLESVGLGL